MLHLLLVHASATSLSWYWLWHPLAGPGYQFWSGIASDVGELTLIGGALALIKHANCDVPGCWRYGPHRDASGHVKLCRHHHPDLKNKKPNYEEILEHHRYHKEQQEASRHG